MDVIFVVPDELVAERVKKIIGEKRGCRIEIVR